MDMKKIFLLIFLLPLLAVAQQKAATKNKPLPKANTKVADEKPVDGFIIRGTIKVSRRNKCCFTQWANGCAGN
jgi:hypothetical protein